MELFSFILNKRKPMTLKLGRKTKSSSFWNSCWKCFSFKHLKGIWLTCKLRPEEWEKKLNFQVDRPVLTSRCRAIDHQFLAFSFVRLVCFCLSDLTELRPTPVGVVPRSPQPVDGVTLQRRNDGVQRGEVLPGSALLLEAQTHAWTGVCMNKHRRSFLCWMRMEWRGNQWETSSEPTNHSLTRDTLQTETQSLCVCLHCHRSDITPKAEPNTLFAHSSYIINAP